MYLLKKPTFLSPSIPKGNLNSKGRRKSKNNKYQSGTSDDWTDLESTEKGTSDVWTESTITDNVQFVPVSSSTPNSLFVQDEKDMLLEAAKCFKIFEGSFETESHANSRFTQNEIHTEKIPKKRSKVKRKQYSGNFIIGKNPKCTMQVQSTNDEWTDLEEDTIKGSLSEYSPVEQTPFAESSNDFSPVNQVSIAGTNDEWTDLEEDTKEGSLSEYSPVEHTRFADSFEFNNCASLTVFTPHPSFVQEEKGMSPGVLRKVSRSCDVGRFYQSSCASEKDPESSFDENQRKSSSDFSPVNQVSIADLVDFQCFPLYEPSKSASPIHKKPSFLKHNNENLLETAHYRRSCEKIFEREFSEISCATHKETESLFDENKRESDNSECFQVNVPSTTASPLYQKTSFLKQKNGVSETAKHRSSFERRFVKESSKNSCGTQKKMHTANIKKRWPKLKKKKLQYSECFLLDNSLEKFKDTTKKVSKMEPTNNDLSHYPICPLGIDLVPGPVRAASPSFFGFDAPIDDIYFLCNGSKLKSKKLGTKRSRQDKSRKR